MAAWSQVFDDGAVLARARRRARRLMFEFALVSGVLVAVAPLATIWGGAQAGRMALACGVVLSASATWVLVRLAREHRRVWRVEVSALGIAAQDVAGRRVALLWRGVDHVDLSDSGLTVTGHTPETQRVRIRVRAAAPAFDALARQVVSRAHAHRRPLAVDGCPVDALSLGALSERNEKKTRRGGSTESTESAG